MGFRNKSDIERPPVISVVIGKKWVEGVFRGKRGMERVIERNK